MGLVEQRPAELGVGRVHPPQMSQRLRATAPRRAHRANSAATGDPERARGQHRRCDVGGRGEGRGVGDEGLAKHVSARFRRRECRAARRLQAPREISAACSASVDPSIVALGSKPTATVRRSRLAAPATTAGFARAIESSIRSPVCRRRYGPAPPMECATDKGNGAATTIQHAAAPPNVLNWRAGAKPARGITHIVHWVSDYPRSPGPSGLGIDGLLGGGRRLAGIILAVLDRAVDAAFMSPDRPQIAPVTHRPRRDSLRLQGR